MHSKYDIIIIGSGVGGLVCGCYLAKTGLKVLIIEQQNKAGGCCGSFDRLGYKFDIGVHYLGGIKYGMLGKIIDELDLRNNIKFNQFNPCDKIIMPNNITYIHSNPEETIASFKNSFPRERANIDEFFNFIWREKFLSVYSKIKKVTFKKILDNFFMDNKIKATLSVLLQNIGLPASKISAKTAILLYREFLMDPGYYPEGGMQKFPDALVDKFKSFGGELILSERVRKILTQNNNIFGVVVGNGNVVLSNIVVSNVSATQTFNSMLDVKNTRESLVVKKMKPSSSLFALYLGVNKPLKTITNNPCSIWFSKTYDLERQFKNLRKIIVNQDICSLMISLPSLHNKRASIVGSLEAFTHAPYESKEFWNRWKEPLLKRMIENIKMLIPSLENNIFMKFAATPLTFERILSNTKGAVCGWAPTLEQSVASLLPQQTSIKGLILAGHWCTTGVGEGGGVAGVASIGRNAARHIVAQYGKGWGYPQFLL